MNRCVPLSDKIIRRYASTAELPGHDVMDERLHTGKLTVTIKTETPIFVADATGFGFFTDGTGRYAIPGSTIRGMVRSAMQVLGFCAFRPEDIDQNKETIWPELSEEHKAFFKDKDMICLDYIWSIMGFVSKKYCYRSRVAFEDCKLIKSAGVETPFIPGYKSQCFAGYKVPVVQNGVENRRWDDMDFRRKKPQMLQDAAFKGTIRFTNLTDDELGLLFWSLLLESKPKCYHSIGQGKSFGYGRVCVTINEAVEYFASDLYSEVSLGREARLLDVNQFIDAYKEYAKTQVNVQDIFDVSTIKNYLKCKSL